ncbi:MAG: hypothetical protein AXW14_14910 [Alteromonas sp. Nap_26]|nr:MAG: hypothetical protein AXW14_14910 [Alteromonas sp. Nap_26]
MISHKRKCIFFHIPKCGGQSVEDIFIRDAGLTWESREPLLLRKNTNPLVGPPWLAHLTYREYLAYNYVSPELMADYYKFAIIRNPYQRLESLYKYMGYDCVMKFSDFISEVIVKNLVNKGNLFYFIKPQYEYLVNNDGVICIDEILKLEEVGYGFKKIAKKLELEESSLPFINAYRKKSFFSKIKKRVKCGLNGHVRYGLNFDYKVSWTNDLLTQVNSYYERDFKEFGYELENK